MFGLLDFLGAFDIHRCDLRINGCRLEFGISTLLGLGRRCLAVAGLFADIHLNGVAIRGFDGVSGLRLVVGRECVVAAEEQTTDHQCGQHRDERGLLHGLRHDLLGASMPRMN